MTNRNSSSLKIIVNHPLINLSMAMVGLLGPFKMQKARRVYKVDLLRLLNKKHQNNEHCHHSVVHCSTTKGCFLPNFIFPDYHYFLTLIIDKTFHFGWKNWTYQFYDYLSQTYLQKKSTLWKFLRDSENFVNQGPIS